MTRSSSSSERSPSSPRSADHGSAADSSTGADRASSGIARTSVAIVGAGPGGLATAMLLAAAGAEVEIYEARDVVGGRTRRTQVGEFAFDTGPTFFMMPYVLDEIFAATGRRLSDHADLHRLDPMYRLLLGQKDGGDPIVLDTTQDIDAMVERISKIDPHDGPAFARFMRDNRRKLSLMEPILRRPVRSLFDLMNLDSMKVAPHLKPWQSLHDYLRGYFRNPLVRLGMSFQSKYLGMSPFECPSLFSILPFIEYEYGIWHPKGGCNALVRAMADVVEDLGGRIHLNTPVERVSFDGRRATGVVAGGVERKHDHVVLNADAPWAIQNLIPAERRRKWTDDRLDRMKYSCSTFMLYLGLDGEVDLPHHTIYTSRTYEDNLADIAVHGRLSADPSIYCCNPSALDDSLAPAGKSALYVLVPTPNMQSGIDWEEARPILRERALDQLESVFRIENVRERIVAEKSVTPADWKDENIAFGATFNLAHSLPQMLHRRPQHQLEDVEGVYLTGGGTHPGSGLPVIFLSSEITAKMICDRSGLPNPLVEPAPVERAVAMATSSS